MTNDTPDLDAVIAELETANDFQTCAVRAHKHWPQLLSAARIAQELTALLGPEPVKRVQGLEEELREGAQAMRDAVAEIESLRADLAEKEAANATLRRLHDTTMTSHEEAANLAHARGIELEVLKSEVTRARQAFIDSDVPADELTTIGADVERLIHEFGIISTGLLDKASKAEAESARLRERLAELENAAKYWEKRWREDTGITPQDER